MIIGLPGFPGSGVERIANIRQFKKRFYPKSTVKK
jgi:hypothetical protein